MRHILLLMSIRTRVIVLLSAVFFAFALVEWGVGKLLLLPRFEQIERDSAATAMKRIDAGLSRALDGLHDSATDWGNWSATYRFALDHNTAYDRENLNAISMRELHVTALAFIDLSGKIVWSYSISPESPAALPLDLFRASSLPADFPWRQNLRDATPAQGLIATNRGVLLAAVAPILDGHGHGPSRGLVFMGRLLTPAEIADIGVKAQTAVELADSASSPGATDGTRFVTTETSTRVFQVVSDIFGKPIMTLRVEVPRTIIANARTTVDSAMAFTIGAAVAALLFMWVVLNRTLFAPLAQVTRHAVTIGAGDDLTTRLNLNRRDEIGSLANEFDRMVAQVAESRRQLIDHSFQAGMAEFSRGVLHNIGNAMTPLSVRVAKLQQRLCAAPLADVERALSECGIDSTSASRRADLDQFLRLASAELVDIIKSAEADASMMARQAGMVQNALSERLPSARTPSVLESVELPAMIHQSLEIVPDSCREQVDIEIDRSLQLVGPIYTARSVLRLILQNLIINAAEAVRAAGQARGLVRFTAVIRSDGGQDKLLLECQDTGIGIEAASLERVFERGFSTKHGSGNSGIGLHWCATAISALGGRIWASSDGAHQGATLHLLIPISIPAGTAGTIAA
jgi:two-component system, NtrC family, sensor kinase